MGVNPVIVVAYKEHILSPNQVSELQTNKKETWSPEGV